MEAEVEAEEAEAFLRDKLVALYFASGRCALSRDFTPLLRRFYAELVERARPPAPLAVVLVSADRSARDMEAFLRPLPGSWLAIPFHDPFRHELRTRYRITATPRLVILKPSGEVITDKGRRQIREQGRACFQSWVEAAEVFQNFSG
ncbi:unnamed protein product [Pipistrellus nathusii]|uniref:Thioredoxin-like fold domain-containing protein n=1 Tax=Pipistrellus nathusii TaxID=59473 RepID=A0ABN9ZBN4_PIPNA